MGFPGQEYQSGLPFPSPGGLPGPGIEPVSLALAAGFFTTAEPPGKCWCVLVSQSCLTPCDPMDCSPPGSSIHGTLQARRLEWLAISFLRGWNSPGKKTGVACHFLLEGIFLTQGLNPGLPHCKQTLPSEPPGKPCPKIKLAGVVALKLPGCPRSVSVFSPILSPPYLQRRTAVCEQALSLPACLRL